MDPAANSDAFEYEPSIDIRDLITLEDVMDELGYGPNGGLVYCFECVSSLSETTVLGCGPVSSATNNSGLLDIS